MSPFDRAVDDAIATLTALREIRETLERAAAMVRECIVDGHKLLVCGNGGSAADGADFATEFACRYSADRRPFPAINLTGCGSLLTATVNDYGADAMFARPVRAFGQPGDILVALSTSGNSPNIIAALREAEAMGLRSIALLGRDGGKAKGLATIDLIVTSNITARIQEGHKFLLHTLCEIVDPSLQAL
jgi:phosphoheptose isomerase